MMKSATFSQRLLRRCLYAAMPVLGLFATVGHGEHSVGNPGDPVRLTISDARDDALVILIRVKPEQLVPVNAAAKSFYKDNYAALSSTLHDAHLNFIKDDKPYCAEAVRTELTIYFSYPKCTETVRSKADAIKLLLHETTHLLGNTDEQLADDVALSIYNTWINLDANTTPRWDPLNPNGAPTGRAAYASVSFLDSDGHSKLFVWGGCNEDNDLMVDCSEFLGDGAVYDVDTQIWDDVPAVPAPLAGSIRAFATAVYTGSVGPAARKILVFGGCNGNDGICRTAFDSVLVYDLATKQWTVMAAGGDVPEARINHSAWWTGREMLIWGGVADPAGPGLGRSLGDGALFNPVTGAWTKLHDAAAPTPRRFASAVLTGTERDPDKRLLIVYGGCDQQVGRNCPKYFDDGAIYSFTGGGSWRPIGKVNFTARAWHSAVWTGQEMVVFGGLNRTPRGDGAIFTPGATAADDKWLLISGIGDDGRWGHNAVWTGDRMVVWGGEARLDEPAGKLLEFFLPTAVTPYGRWETPLALASPVGRWGESAYWVGRGMLLWGGMTSNRAYLNSGGLYVPKVAPQ